MADSHDDRGSDRRPTAVRTPDAERGVAEAVKFAELRSLLTGPERRELVDLKAQFADREARTLQVREVLPEAIALTATDPDIVRALTPAIEQAIRASARKDPRALVDALLPVIGRTLRKSIVQTLKPLIALGCAVLLVGGVWAFQAFRARQAWDDYLERLGAEPGIVVIQNGRHNGKFFVTGLRDELAVDPATLIASAGLTPESVEGRWEPYQALHPAFVSERARTLLRPPSGVALAYRDGVLTATGTASAEWVSESRRLAPAIAGVRHFEFSGQLPEAAETSLIAAAKPPVPEPPPKQSEASAVRTLPRPIGGSPERKLIDQIEVSSLVFSQTHRDLAPGQDATVRRLASLFRELNEIAHARRARGRIDFLAHTRESASVADRNLATTRANAALALFRPYKFDSLALTADTETSAPSPPSASQTDRDWSRRVSFRVRWLARP